MVTVVNVVTEFEQLLQGYEVRNTCFRVRPSFQRLLIKQPPPPPPQETKSCFGGKTTFAEEES